MDYYNKIDDAYLAELHKPMRKMYVKMEILSHYEGAIGEITSDLSSTDGSITINKEQGCRRSCSLSIIANTYLKRIAPFGTIENLKFSLVCKLMKIFIGFHKVFLSQNQQTLMVDD